MHTYICATKLSKHTSKYRHTWVTCMQKKAMDIYTHTQAHSVVQPFAPKSVMKPYWRSTEEAGGGGQVGLRSHSDNHLAFTSNPGLSVQSLGGMVRRSNLAKQRAEVRGGLLDVVNVGHQEGPSLIWCHKKAKAAFPVLYPGVPACWWVKLTTDKTLWKPKSMKETFQILCLPVTSRTANTWRTFQIWSSDY